VHGERWFACPAPLLFYMARVVGGPQPREGIGAPDQSATRSVS